MKRFVVLLPLAVALGALTWAIGQQPATAPTAEATAKTVLERYAAALNQRKTAAIEPFLAESVDHIADDGTATTGRANVLKLYESIAGDAANFSVALTVNSAKFVTANVLLIDGAATIKSGDSTETARFESVWEKAGANWQAVRIRELGDGSPVPESNAEYLKEIDWLVGDWTAESAEYKVAMTVKYGKNRNFLIGEQSITRGNDEVVTVMKVIGYDAVRGELRTWLFDSDGGFGGGSLVRQGASWVDSTEFQTRGGDASTATHTFRPNTNGFTWTSTDRILDGKPLPDLKLNYVLKAGTK